MTIAMVDGEAADLEEGIRPLIRGALYRDKENLYMDKITTGGQGPKMGRSKDLYRYYSVRRAAKMGAYVCMGRGRSMGPDPRGGMPHA